MSCTPNTNLLQLKATEKKLFIDQYSKTHQPVGITILKFKKKKNRTVPAYRENEMLAETVRVSVTQTTSGIFELLKFSYFSQQVFELTFAVSVE